MIGLLRTLSWFQALTCLLVWVTATPFQDAQRPNRPRPQQITGPVEGEDPLEALRLPNTIGLAGARRRPGHTPLAAPAVPAQVLVRTQRSRAARGTGLLRASRAGLRRGRPHRRTAHSRMPCSTTSIPGAARRSSRSRTSSASTPRLTLARLRPRRDRDGRIGVPATSSRALDSLEQAWDRTARRR